MYDHRILNCEDNGQMGVITVHGAIMLPLCNVSLSEGG